MKMLKDQLYTLIGMESEAGLPTTATIEIHPDHAIFDGHFPGQPILPGVCTLQIVKELINQLSPDFSVLEASMVKYLKIVDPTVNRILTYVFQWKEEADSILPLAITGSFDDQTFVKCQLKIGKS